MNHACMQTSCLCSHMLNCWIVFSAPWSSGYWGHSCFCQHFYQHSNSHKLRTASCRKNKKTNSISCRALLDMLSQTILTLSFSNIKICGNIFSYIFQSNGSCGTFIVGGFYMYFAKLRSKGRRSLRWMCICKWVHNYNNALPWLAYFW